MEENLLLDENLIATKSGESIDIAMIGMNSSFSHIKDDIKLMGQSDADWPMLMQPL